MMKLDVIDRDLGEKVGREIGNIIEGGYAVKLSGVGELGPTLSGFGSVCGCRDNPDRRLWWNFAQLVPEVSIDDQDDSIFGCNLGISDGHRPPLQLHGQQLRLGDAEIECLEQ